jgi:hypothetical protein
MTTSSSSFHSSRTNPGKSRRPSWAGECSMLGRKNIRGLPGPESGLQPAYNATPCTVADCSAKLLRTCLSPWPRSPAALPSCSFGCLCLWLAPEPGLPRPKASHASGSRETPRGSVFWEPGSVRRARVHAADSFAWAGWLACGVGGSAWLRNE